MHQNNIPVFGLLHHSVNDLITSWVFLFNWVHIPMIDLQSSVLSKIDDFFIGISTRGTYQLHIFITYFFVYLFGFLKIFFYLFGILIEITFVAIAEHPKFMLAFTDFFQYIWMPLCPLTTDKK